MRHVRPPEETIDEPGGGPGGHSFASGDGGGACVELLDPDRLLADPAAEWLVRHARLALDHLGCTGEVRVRVVNDAQMIAAHARAMGLDTTTDVLTFDLREPGGASGHSQGSVALDTDLLICVDEAGRQAAMRGHDARRELLLYILHGVLHCLGEDDHDEEAFRRMHAREDEVLDAIGVGATFTRTPLDGKGDAC